MKLSIQFIESSIHAQDVTEYGLGYFTSSSPLSSANIDVSGAMYIYEVELA